MLPFLWFFLLRKNDFSINAQNPAIFFSGKIWLQEKKEVRDYCS